MDEIFPLRVESGLNDPHYYGVKLGKTSELKMILQPKKWLLEVKSGKALVWA
jgi:hypothetical protein